MNTSPVPDVYARLRRTGVVAVLMLDDADNAVPLARALLAGGVDCMELTLRTPAALGRRSFVRLHRAAEGVRSSTLTPAKRRQAVEHVRDTLGRDEVTERRACRVLGQARNTHRRHGERADGDPTAVAVHPGQAALILITVR